MELTLLAILFAISLATSSVGWKKFIYFISLGYAFSIALMALALAFVYFDNLTWQSLILCLLMVVYGCRLGGYLAVREIKSAYYRKELAESTKTEKPITAGGKIAIWISCSILYVCQISPIAFRLVNATAADGWLWAGISVTALGLIVESVADWQKSNAKKTNPKRFVDSGLYRIVRCPNYLGEILVWSGVFISGVPVYGCIWEWVCALAGYVAIVYIMFGGARRLELRQNRNYGSDPEYQDYIRRIPIIIPLIPLYSVAPYTWLKG